MTEVVFEPFPKMGRLTRECLITEKIDGTNAQIIITDDGRIVAGSCTRLITPDDDNYGFARWVEEHKSELLALGPGRHFGEWWGQKIQRAYGLTEKRFSLFNVSRWCASDAIPKCVNKNDPNPKKILKYQTPVPLCCSVVPELYCGLFGERIIDNMLEMLRVRGSVAAPGFMNPEGVVIFHTATGTMFKKTLENDCPKGSA